MHSAWAVSLAPALREGRQDESQEAEDVGAEAYLVQAMRTKPGFPAQVAAEPDPRPELLGASVQHWGQRSPSPAAEPPGAVSLPSCSSWEHHALS